MLTSLTTPSCFSLCTKSKSIPCSRSQLSILFHLFLEPVALCFGQYNIPQRVFAISPIRNCYLVKCLTFIFINIADQGNLVVHRHAGINPMYLEATPFHTSKPCHLAFCKLVYSYFKTAKHLFIRKLTYYILGYILIFDLTFSL